MISLHGSCGAERVTIHHGCIGLARPVKQMTLAQGSKLGPYEILAQIGAGGMGEVYRARDPRVGRDVAIKVSAEQFSERFEREARAVAALNHSNICTLYDVGPDYLVMELIEGPTLADRVKQGPIPLDESLEIARQIADALEAAHEKGIVHRDLKPANIKVRPDGIVKVLDFGLAKVAETPVADSNNSPTLSMAATRQGVILGTAAYMSPEQARGKPVDKRADIWAFGVLLYEMLTGRQLFSGEDITEILAAVVKEQPDLSKAPAQARPLLKSCIEKDPRKRLRDIGDIQHLLDAPAPPAVSSKRTGRLGWAIAAVLALLAIAAIISCLKTRSSVDEIAKTTLTIVPPSGTTLDPVGSLSSAPEISPNGAFVTYRARDAAGVGLFVRPLNSLSAQRVPGSEKGSNAPFWSADSTSVVYPAGDQLIKVVLPDGSPQTIAKNPSASRGESWSDGGTILIALIPGLFAVPASGGDLQPVDVSAVGSGIYLNPEFLSAGEDFLFLYAPGSALDTENWAVYLATLRDKKVMNPVVLLRNATAARYTPAGGGRILFVREDKLYSQKLDRKARKLEGEAELTVSGVASIPGGGTNRGDFSVARTGTIAWRPGRAALTQVMTFDRQGHQIGTTGPPGIITSLRLSPDEKQLLAGKWLLDDNQQGRLALPAEASWFGWSPDGSKLMGIRRPDQFVEMFATGPLEIHASAGSNRGSGLVIPQDTSPDGKWLLGIPLGSNSILAENMQGAASGLNPVVVVQTGELLGTPRFSPDGRWIVYYARDLQSATSSLFVQPFPGPGTRRQLATGGICPEWRKDGREILYLTPPPQGEIQTVAVESDGSNLRFSAPQKLFSGFRRIATTNASRPIAVSRDGSRIYIPQPVEQPDSNMIHIMMGGLK